jgi:hypothetical protein
VAPTFNYFQTALVLAAGGHLDVEDVERVARALVGRSGYTPRRLDNSLADICRRGLLPPDTGVRLGAPLRAARLLPPLSAARGSWLQRLRDRLRRASRRQAPAAPRPAGALDYDALLEHLRPARGAPAREARPT